MNHTNHRRLSPRICPWCGATFPPHNSAQKYCNRRCSNSAYGRGVVHTAAQDFRAIAAKCVDERDREFLLDCARHAG